MTGQARRTGYHFVKNHWSVRAGEWSLYALAYGFRIGTWPVGTWTLSGVFAPLGGIVARSVPAFRRRAESNLARVWPEMPASDRARLVGETGRQFMRLMVEYARLDRFLDTVEIETEGAEHLAAARAVGRGVILVTAHFGNWEPARLSAKRLGAESGILYRAFNNRYLDRYGWGLLGEVGEPVLHKGPRGLRALIGHVSRGGTIMVLVDQRNTGAPMIPFLGHAAETSTVPAEIARRTGAALIPVSARRDIAARRFVVRFEAPVEGGDAAAMMADVNERIAAWVREAPEQWFWFHRRWKTAG